MNKCSISLFSEIPISFVKKGKVQTSLLYPIFLRIWRKRTLWYTCYTWKWYSSREEWPILSIFNTWIPFNSANTVKQLCSIQIEYGKLSAQWWVTVWLFVIMKNHINIKQENCDKSVLWNVGMSHLHMSNWKGHHVSSGKEAGFRTVYDLFN